ncbi:MAG TPA: dihydrolipoamide succinyltransferase, partial [Gammaproteobacteria bacterium]|nr:dihydrolipoamide succinyltransferase [Gammaproteobacteria bacterium]
MSIEIKVPELPESVADAIIANWYKKVGDTIDVDEVLVDLETDKVILEVPAIKQGVVKKILSPVGDTVTAGQLLAVIDTSVQPVA